MPENLNDILKKLQSGDLPLDQAEQLIKHLQAQPLGFATVDHARSARCGAAEVIYAAGKTPQQVVAITQSIRKHHPATLITRCNDGHIDALKESFPASDLNIASRAGTAIVGHPPAAPETGAKGVCIITAGTSDQPVAEEAELTCIALSRKVTRVNDVGVAGLHRLGNQLDSIRNASCIIVIAGMEGALPSVVGGLVDVPVIAVPTSVGYGASFGGISALLGMLNTCASGVTVVNIDNGFGAAYSACMIDRQSK